MNLNRFIKERLCYKGCSQTIYANFSTINIEFFKHYTDNIFFSSGSWRRTSPHI